MVPPKVFISHASEDKGRFVRDLATKLREAGVDAWFDRWEIAAGESLVQRIFEIGIGGCDAFLVVISNHSVDKPWVMAELDVGVVRSIESQTRLIPVRLDGVTMPVALQAKKWVSVVDTSAYDDEFQEILRALFEIDVRPPIGTPPPFALTTRIGGLEASDSVVLRLMAEGAIVRDSDFVDQTVVGERAQAAGISSGGLRLSEDALKAGRYIDYVEALGGRRLQYSVTGLGWQFVLPALYPDIVEARQAMIGLLVNEYADGIDAADLARRLNRPRRVVIALLRPLQARQLVWLIEPLSGEVRVLRVAPLLARELS